MFLAENQQRIGAKIMTDKTGLTGLTRDYATGDSPQAHRVPERRRWTDVMMHRWPTALGIAVAALTAIDLQLNVEFVSFLSALVVVMAFVYVGAAILDRRNYAWVVFLAAFAVLALTQVLDLMINLPVGNCADQADSHSRPPECSRSARPRWWRSTWIPTRVGTSWPSPSSATLSGMPSTMCRTGWSRVRMRSSAPSWTSWLARPFS
jgi:hypothetical protein